MTSGTETIIAIVIPLITAVLVLLIGNKLNAVITGAVSFVAAVINAGIVFSMAPAVLAGKDISFVLCKIAETVNISFGPDPAGIIFACAVSALWVISSLFSMGNSDTDQYSHRPAVNASFAGSVAALLGVAFAPDPVTFCIFYLLFMLLIYPMVLTRSDSGKKIRGLRYLIFSIAGAVLFAFSTYYVCKAAEDPVFTPGGFLTEEMLPGKMALVIFVLMSVAGLVQAGFFPFHNWLPEAESFQTSSDDFVHIVAASNAGAFCIFRIVLYVFGPSLARSCFGADVLSWLAVATIAVSSLIAMKKIGLRVKIAYSTSVQMAVIVLGICALTPFSTAGALYQIAAQALSKTVLIMAAVMLAGPVKGKTHETGGNSSLPTVIMIMTVTGVFLTIGLPPSAGFVGITNMIYGAVAAGKPVYVIAICAGELLTLAYLIPAVMAEFRHNKTGLSIASDDNNVVFRIAAAAITIIAVIALGIAPDLGLDLFELALQAGNEIFTPLM